jgi:hypothetical protein
MSSEIIQSVAYDIYYDDFQHINFIFPQNLISLFLVLFPPHPTIKLMSEDERELARQNTIA